MKKMQVLKQVELESLLKEASHDQLVQLLLSLANNNQALKNELILELQVGDSVLDLETFKEVIDLVVKKYLKIGYGLSRSSLIKLTEELSLKLDQIRDCLDMPHFLVALQMAHYVYNTCELISAHCDDSEGYLVSLTDEIETLMYVIVSRSIDEGEEVDAVFQYLLKHLQTYQTGVDFMWLGLAIEFCDEVEKLEEILDLISKWTKQTTNKRELSRLYEMWYQLLVESEIDGASDAFLKEHQDVECLQAIRIERLVVQKQYDEAIRLMNQIREKDSRLFNREWKDYYYNTYQQFDDKQKLAQLAEEFALEGDMNYYQKLKELRPNDYLEVYRKIKDKYYQKRGITSQMFESLIMKENDWDELLMFVREDPQSIEKYAKVLVEHFPQEVSMIYYDFLLHRAIGLKGTRAHYQMMCRQIGMYRPYASKEQFSTLLSTIKGACKSRRALMEELNKIDLISRDSLKIQ